ncbi:hypothetical protein MMC08_008223 [Hypocenomyce scalaris]|nr:hypothetical protein [Hypocenomyce scalaris]
MASLSEEPTIETAPSQERLDELLSTEERPTSDETGRIKEEDRQTTPSSPRRNGIPPKRPLTTAKRTAGTTPSPAPMSTTSSACRATPGSGLSKPPTRPTASSTARRPPTNVTAATAASSGHRLRASRSSFDDGKTVATGSVDENKKRAIGGAAKHVSISGPTSSRSSAANSISSSTDPQPSLGSTAPIDRQIGTRASAVSPAKSALRPTTNNARPNTATTARSARLIASSTRGTTATATSGLAKKRLSTIPASPAAAKNNVIASDTEKTEPSASRKPARPALGTRKSTTSVGIEQRLQEMELVNQMLRAAMAEDGDEDDEVKEEYEKKVDETLASLRMKLEEARRNEAEEGIAPTRMSAIKPGVGDAHTDGNVMKETSSRDETGRQSDIDAMQLQTALLESRMKVQIMEGELEVLQAKMREYSTAAAEVSKEVQEATENIRREHALKVDELLTSHTNEIDPLRARLDEADKTHKQYVEQSVKEIEEARAAAAQNGSKAVAKKLEEQQKAHGAALNALEADLATERANGTETALRLEQLLSYISTLESRLEEHRNISEEALQNCQRQSTQATKEKDRAIEVKDQDILTLQRKMQELQDTQSLALEEVKSAAMRSSSALESEISALRAKLVEAEDKSLLASTRHDELVQAKDRDLKGMRQVIENLQNELQQLHESKGRELDSHKINLIQEHESAIGMLKAEHQAVLVSAQNQRHEAAQSIHLAHEQELQNLLRDHDITQDELQKTMAELVASKAEFQAKFDSIMAGHTNELRAHHAKHENSKQLLNEAKAAQQEASETIDTLKEKIIAVESEKEESKIATIEMQKDLERASGEVASLRKVLEAFDDESKNKDEQHASTIKKLKEEAAVLAKILDQTNSEGSSAKETHTAALQALRDRHTKEIEELKANSDQKHNAAIQGLQSQHDKVLKALKKTEEEHPAALEKLKGDHSKALEKHIQSLNEVNVGHAKELEELRIRLERQHSQSKQDFEANSADKAFKAENKHLKDLDDLQKEHEKKYSQLRKEMEDAGTQNTSATNKAHETALSELQSQVEQQKEALAQTKCELQAAQDNNKEVEDHKALLDELKVELEQAASVKKELESTLRHLAKARDDVVPIVQELENLKQALPIAKAEAEQHREAVEAANLKVKGQQDKLAAALAEAEEHKTNHRKALAELSTFQPKTTEANAAASEMTQAQAFEVNQELEALQLAADAERDQNTKLKVLLQKAEETAEQHATKVREVEAALKVTTAELIEMQTKRAEGSGFVSSPPPKGGLRLSRWPAGSPAKNGEKEDGAEGEELGSHIEGTMAGLQEQVRQLEGVNEDMLEETARIVNMLSKITEPNTLEGGSSRSTSPPRLPLSEVLDG